MSAIVDLMLAGLKKPAPATRIETLRTLAMLEETLALPTLRAMVAAETNAESVTWAAQRCALSLAA